MLSIFNTYMGIISQMFYFKATVKIILTFDQKATITELCDTIDK